ncbi:MAG: hypothetical protein AAB393_05225 [Bacteroidota bacterium]
MASIALKSRMKTNSRERGKRRTTHKNNSGRRRASVYDLTLDVCGSLDSGTTDRATNKKWLQGYGR